MSFEVCDSYPRFGPSCMRSVVREHFLSDVCLSPPCCSAFPPAFIMATTPSMPMAPGPNLGPPLPSELPFSCVPLSIWSYVNVPWLPHIPNAENGTPLLKLTSVCPSLWVCSPPTPASGNPRLIPFFPLSHPYTCLSPALWWYLLNISQISPLLLITTTSLKGTPPIPAWAAASTLDLVSLSVTKLRSVLLYISNYIQNPGLSSFASRGTLTRSLHSQTQCHLENRDDCNTFLMRLSAD